LRGAVELAAANLEDDSRNTVLGLSLGHALARRICTLSFSVPFDRDPWLRFGDDLLDLRLALGAQLFLVPVRLVFVDDDFGLGQERAFPGFGVHQRERHFGHAQGLALPRAGEDDVFHLAAAQSFGALLAEHPAHSVENVRFAAPVGAHNDGDALAGHGHLGAIEKRFKAQNLNLLQLQHEQLLLVQSWGKDRVRAIIITTVAALLPEGQHTDRNILWIRGTKPNYWVTMPE
jgi:hypothetical protein